MLVGACASHSQKEPYWMKLSSKKSPSFLSEKEAFLKLRSVGQEHLLNHLKKLSTQEKKNLIRQITHLDISLFRRKQEELSNKNSLSAHDFQSFEAYSPEGNQEDFHLGMQLVGAGKTALLILAGGQGSRLRCKGPKG